MSENRKATWSDVLAWAKAEIEKARDGLEKCSGEPLDIARLQTRIAVMRELQAINEIPAAAAMPPSVPYA